MWGRNKKTRKKLYIQHMLKLSGYSVSNKWFVRNLCSTAVFFPLSVFCGQAEWARTYDKNIRFFFLGFNSFVRCCCSWIELNWIELNLCEIRLDKKSLVESVLRPVSILCLYTEQLRVIRNRVESNENRSKSRGNWRI